MSCGKHYFGPMPVQSPGPSRGGSYHSPSFGTFGTVGTTVSANWDRERYQTPVTTDSGATGPKETIVYGSKSDTTVTYQNKYVSLPNEMKIDYMKSLYNSIQVDTEKTIDTSENEKTINDFLSKLDKNTIEQNLHLVQNIEGTIEEKLL